MVAVVNNTIRNISSGSSGQALRILSSLVRFNSCAVNNAQDSSILRVLCNFCGISIF